MKKKISLFLLILCVISVTLLLTACGGVENGFEESYGCEPQPEPNYCAYKSKKTEFDINDVTLDFYYGGYYPHGIEYELNNGRSYPVFEVFFSSEGNKYLIKRVEENFVSEKYSCTVKNLFFKGKIKYNYSETITIPSELFTKESGWIYFLIYSARAMQVNEEFFCITSIGIYYKVSGDKVTLSNKEF